MLYSKRSVEAVIVFYKDEQVVTRFPSSRWPLRQRALSHVGLEPGGPNAPPVLFLDCIQTYWNTAKQTTKKQTKKNFDCWCSCCCYHKGYLFLFLVKALLPIAGRSCTSNLWAIQPLSVGADYLSSYSIIGKECIKKNTYIVYVFPFCSLLRISKRFSWAGLQ